jgi:hypothetical protein
MPKKLAGDRLPKPVKARNFTQAAQKAEKYFPPRENASGDFSGDPFVSIWRSYS